MKATVLETSRGTFQSIIIRHDNISSQNIHHYTLHLEFAMSVVRDQEVPNFHYS